MNTHDALAWRYATKKFDPARMITEDTLTTLLEALRVAPSSYGLQPWRFYLVEDPAMRAQIRAHAWDQAQVTDAAHLIAIAARTEATEADVLRYIEDMKHARGVTDEAIAGYRGMMLNAVRSLTPEQSGAWNARQAYLALGFLLSCAAHLEVDTCPMEGFDAEKVSALLGATEAGYRVCSLVALGYRSTQDPYAALSKVRYPLAQVLVRV